MVPPYLQWVYPPGLTYLETLLQASPEVCLQVTTHLIKLTINSLYPRSQAAAKCPLLALCTSTPELPWGTSFPSIDPNSSPSSPSFRIALLQYQKSKASQLVGSDWTRSQVVLTEPEEGQQSQTHGGALEE